MNVSASRIDVGDDEPVLLSAAVVLFFPAGQMKLSTLRTEARKGRLATSRVGGKDYVTHRAIKDMFELCRVQRNHPASKSATKAEDEYGSSETARLTAERDALLIRLETPNSRFANTSRTKTAGRTQASVTPLRLGSRT